MNAREARQKLIKAGCPKSILVRQVRWMAEDFYEASGDKKSLDKCRASLNPPVTDEAFEFIHRTLTGGRRWTITVTSPSGEKLVIHEFCNATKDNAMAIGSAFARISYFFQNDFAGSNFTPHAASSPSSSAGSTRSDSK